MKKTFPLHAPGKADARVLDAIKHDIRKYVKRERGKLLPDGFGVWRFDCKVGVDGTNAETKDLKEISRAIDQVAQAGGASVYVEVIAAPDHHAPAAIPSPGSP